MKPYLLTSLLLSISCTGFLDKETEAEEEEEEESLHRVHCDSNIKIIFPDETETELDFCTDGAIEAKYEFSEEEPPAPRDMTLRFSAMAEEDGLECYISIYNPSICSTGYYDLSQNSGSVDVIMIDCGTEYSDQYSVSSGYLRVDHLAAGLRPGNQEGKELMTSVGGLIEAETSGGLRIEGDFSIGRKVLAEAAGEVSCTYDDGDADDDGVLNPVYGGDDCDDENPDLGSVLEDGDCDGTLTADDCDDSDASSTIVADDNDCDGILSSNDCDDNDAGTVNDMDCDGVPSSQDCDDYDSSTVNDMDCDGVSSSQDCDDNDPNTIYDMDCDGTQSSYDCDDNDANSTIVANDADCDGTESWDDCDDEDFYSNIVADDHDCDGALTADDCDDYDAGSTIVADDGDCDGTLTADDCDDNDASSTVVANDNDCDGNTSFYDCDDNDPNSTTISNDYDCDGTVTADDCNDYDPNSTIVSNDGDCDGYTWWNDCDDNDANIQSPANDQDCDGVDTSDDCDDNDASSTIVADDGDCDGVLTVDDCDDTDPALLEQSNDADCDGVLTADDCDDTIPNDPNDQDCDGYLANSGGSIGCYTFTMYDSYGDGWNGNSIQMYEDGSYTDNVTLSSGSSGSDTFCPDSSTALLEMYFNDGSYNSEVSFTMTDDSGNTVGTGQGGSSNSLSFNGSTYYDGQIIYSTTGSGSGDYDCDDNDPSSTHSGIDADCDGTLTADDCDDNDASSTIIVNDPDCDGIPGGNPAVLVDQLVVGDIIITEIMNNPSNTDDNYGEWFEIYNNTSDSINLNGLMVSNSSSLSFTISDPLVVSTHSFVVLGRNADSTLNGGVSIDYEYGGQRYLTNGSDELILSNASGTLDEVAWDNGASFPDPAGASISLNPSFFDPADNDNGANWCEASTDLGNGDFGTPGASNDTCPP